MGRAYVPAAHTAAPGGYLLRKYAAVFFGGRRYRGMTRGYSIYRCGH